MNKKVYIIWIWWIGTSWIARYYHTQWYDVFWSDLTDSQLIQQLQNEGMNIIIWCDENLIDTSFEKVIFTEAIPNTQKELQKAREIGIETLSYPEALWEIANDSYLIWVAGTHGKSTTSALVSLVLLKSHLWVNAIVGSLLWEFGWKNTYFSNSSHFVIEACEYKRSFLNYRPNIGVITNIDLDHLDYYKDIDDYRDAFISYIHNIKPNGYLIIDGKDPNIWHILDTRDDLTLIEVFQTYYIMNNKKIDIPSFDMQVLGDHIKLDANIAYIIGKLLDMSDKDIIQTLTNYTWIWRRSEYIWYTENQNILMSDYGHHPTELFLNIPAIKKKYPDKELITIFQPHQYSRTLELLEWFQNAFWASDILIIPNIYQSRDSKEDMEKIDGEKLTSLIHHPHKIFWDGLENTLKIIKEFDKIWKWKYVFLLQWAWDIDNLRYEIPTIK